ncbi:MAG TPA: crossover junction endodeoxyribonuclease RuvC [Thermodesulfovibrionales bacterium]|jgi:crossover junction endodeoxyribonuclease RuvC|nr:crossover junction endodeoxyribonuclease RuvC [Thermodesulfovibrionales bacterium]
MIILGIDPGLASTGFGVIRCDKVTPSIVKCGYIKTSAKEHVSNRLFQIYSDINQLIRSLNPDLIAIENIFSLVRYPKAGILLGGVLGIIYLSVSQNNVSMIEITPKEVKNSLTGYGGANKYQVREAIKYLLKMTDVKSFHATDALAIALTAFYRKNPRKGR